MTPLTTTNVALCLDENYVEPARTLIESMRAHHAAGQLAIWLLHEDLSPQSLQRFEAQCAGWAKVQAVAIDVDLAPYFGAGDQWLPYQNKSVLYRILLPNLLLTRGVERVLYVDCDILCVGSLTVTVDISLDGATLGAVQDAFTPRLSSDGGIPGFIPESDEDYFNSGVLLIDTRRWHSHQVEDRALDYLQSVRGSQRFYDQDALNVVCIGDWIPLDGSFNTMITDPFEADLISALDSSRLVHFVGPHKPWHSDYYPGNRRTMYELHRAAWRTRDLATAR